MPRLISSRSPTPEKRYLNWIKIKPAKRRAKPLRITMSSYSLPAEISLISDSFSVSWIFIMPRERVEMNIIMERIERAMMPSRNEKVMFSKIGSALERIRKRIIRIGMPIKIPLRIEEVTCLFAEFSEVQV